RLATATHLARLYAGLASDQPRTCPGLHRRCNDALLPGSRPSRALPTRSHYLGLGLRHWMAPNIHYLNLPMILERTGASCCIRGEQGLNVSIALVISTDRRNTF